MLQSDGFDFPAGARDIEAYIFFVNYVTVAVRVQRNFPKVFVVLWVSNLGGAVIGPSEGHKAQARPKAQGSTRTNFPRGRIAR
jgi:hypothetical protein